MPGFDGTGPLGAGPRTGGGAGYCTYGGWRGFNRSGRGVGRGGFPWGGGRGRTWGGGRGWQWRSFVRREAFVPYPSNYPYQNFPYSPEEEKSFLKNELSLIQRDMDGIKQRLEELSSEQHKKESNRKNE